ncbi:MAG: intradiol ring-cleavage dioxygenase [Bacteroidota bacterium]
MERKNFLRTFVLAAAAGPILIDACKKDSVSTTVSDPSGVTSATDTNAGSSACRVTPTEVEGPYPYPGGEYKNPLNRIDILGGQTGVPLTLNLVVVNVNDNCNVVPNARVDIWHCSKDGYYSGHANQNGKSFVGETFLRGYQTADDKGAVTFKTIYPGWYSGRATHIHFEIFVNGVLKKAAQFAFPENISNAVHANYGVGTNPTTNASDGILGNSATDLANETPSLTGSIADGYTGTYTFGIAL